MGDLFSLFFSTGTAWAHSGEDHSAGGVPQAASQAVPPSGDFLSNLTAQIGTADALLFFLFILGAVILYERQAKLMDLTKEVLAELRSTGAGERGGPAASGEVFAGQDAHSPDQTSFR